MYKACFAESFPTNSRAHPHILYGPTYMCFKECSKTAIENHIGMLIATKLIYSDGIAGTYIAHSSITLQIKIRKLNPQE